MAGSGRPSRPSSATAATPGPAPIDMALDTVAAILRILGDNALDQEDMKGPGFTALCGRWAEHVLLATPPPGGAAAVGGAAEARRDWLGVREFVRRYCRGSRSHARTIMNDLRQVVWVFIQNLSHTFAHAEAADARIKDHLTRLETLARTADAAQLKDEAIAIVLAISQIVEQQRAERQQQISVLGAHVHALGSGLHGVTADGDTDPLTQLYDRTAFEAYAAQTIDLQRAFGNDACLLMLDVDGLRAINEATGRNGGDALLCKVADAVTRIFFRKNDFVARIGGDEIAVVLRETSRADGLMLGQRVLKAVRAIEVPREGARIPVTASVALAGLQPGEDHRSWIDRAQRTLGRAKAEGRDRLAAD